MGIANPSEDMGTKFKGSHIQIVNKGASMCNLCPLFWWDFQETSRMVKNVTHVTRVWSGSSLYCRHTTKSHSLSCISIIAAIWIHPLKIEADQSVSPWWFRCVISCWFYCPCFAAPCSWLLLMFKKKQAVSVYSNIRRRKSASQERITQCYQVVMSRYLGNGPCANSRSGGNNPAGL